MFDIRWVVNFGQQARVRFSVRDETEHAFTCVTVLLSCKYSVGFAKYPNAFDVGIKVIKELIYI